MGSVPVASQQRLEELRRKLEALEKSVPEGDGRKVIPPALPLELQPNTKMGILGAAITLGKVADPVRTSTYLPTYLPYCS